MMANLIPPTSLKPVSHYLKVAVEHDTRDPVIAYWARFAAVQKSLSIDKSSPEAKGFVISLLEWLETKKKSQSSNEAITIEAAGEAHIENYALKLFNWADQSDRNAVFNKNVVKAFYTSGILFDVLESLRPPLSDDFTKARKYAKWKAAYIHNCLKNGETPVPGEGLAPEDDEDEELDHESGGQGPSASGGYGFVMPPNDNVSPHVQVPYVPPPTIPSPRQDYTPPVQEPPPQVGNPSTSLSVEQIAKAQKYCKWAGSALNFDDVNNAIENLEKALTLLKTGEDLG
ncbi:unnamed protein product [Orchesella dallaii]|uniref:Vacuolar protein sorting-associated protein VTA1 n=1 Tax=Orchesella dallaii TaxID=48710 RepID=A0ABP1QN58_9HEXA